MRFNTIVILSAVLGAAVSNAAETQGPKHRRFSAVAFTDVKLGDQFWAPRIRTNREKSLPHNFKWCEETGRISNFAKAGKLISSKSETPSALDTTGELYQQIQKAFDRTHGSWAEVACQTPYGNQLAWQRLRTEGEQEVHYLRENGSEVYIKRPCVLDVFARIEGRYLVLVVWRAPAAIEDAARIGEVAPLVAGTLLEGQKG